MIYGHDLSKLPPEYRPGLGDTSFTIDFTGPTTEAGTQAGNWLLGKLGKLGELAKLANEHTKLGAGMCDVEGKWNKVLAAKYDPKLRTLFESKGYETGYSGGDQLSEQQLRGFLEEAFKQYPDLAKFYPPVNALINTAKNRTPSLH